MALIEVCWWPYWGCEDKFRDFSLNSYKWSWQVQLASVFSEVPKDLFMDLLQRGVIEEWRKVVAARKKELNGFAKASRVRNMKQDKTKAAREEV